MKFILKLLIVLASLVGLVLVIALFVDGSFKVERKITVAAPDDLVFEYLTHLENQEDFGVWFSYDPDMEITYKGTPGEVGYTIAWESTDERVGKGEQEIVAIEEGKRIDCKLRFIEPEQMESDLYFLVQPVEGGNIQSNITWGIKGEVPYPWNITMLFMDMDKEMGNDFDEGLKSLKVLIEKKFETLPANAHPDAYDSALL